MSLPSQSFCNVRSNASGFTLVELMIALLLGLIVVGSALAIFSSNKQTYVATESLGRIQENTRVAFELMARDIREAGGGPCSKNNPVSNVLNNPGSQWWSNWTDPVMGYGGAPTTSPPANYAAGDSIELKSGTSIGSGVSIKMHINAASFQVTTVNHGLQPGDVVMACDYGQSSIFQITGPSAPPGTNDTVVHETGNTVSPGNCSKGLGLPTLCTAIGNPHTYGANAVLAKLSATRWFIGTNPRGGRSLYQSFVRNKAGTMQVDDQEIAEGVNNMTLQYLLPGALDYVAAASVPAAQWKNVLAVRVILAMQGQDLVNGQLLTRQLAHVVTLRNRAS